MALEKLLKRFQSKIDATGDCWEWKGAISNSSGYARAWYNGDTIHAHRAIYMSLGGEIPKGMDLDHLCFNILCVNPGHMEVVTHKENMRRRKCVVLDVNKVEKIKEMVASGVKQYKVARIFGTDQGTVSRIINGKAWVN